MKHDLVDDIETMTLTLIIYLFCFAVYNLG